MNSLKKKLDELPKSWEGHWNFLQKDIVEYIKQFNIKTMLEIGFNTGYSATLFLELLDLDKFYSIDIGTHEHVRPLYTKFKKMYKDKFNCIIDDSLNIRKTFLNDIQYDLIFIDGCHSFELALNDFLFCIEPPKTKYILLDDTGGRSSGVTKLLKYINEKGYKLTLIKEWTCADLKSQGCILYKL